MIVKDLTFPGGVILGAGLMYLLDPERARTKSPISGMSPGLRCAAGAIGLVAVALGARLFARCGAPESSTSTALDVDMPNYAWLR